MDELEKLNIELDAYKNAKAELVNKQKYEAASIVRDFEREVLNQIDEVHKQKLIKELDLIIDWYIQTYQKENLNELVMICSKDIKRTIDEYRGVEIITEPEIVLFGKVMAMKENQMILVAKKILEETKQAAFEWDLLKLWLNGNEDLFSK